MYQRRKLEELVEPYWHSPEILAIVGPRQCGKTSLLKHWEEANPGSLYLTFEDPQVLSLFEEDVELFYERYLQGRQLVFFDEFQYAKEGGKKLKYLFDTKQIKIVISGSSAIDLTIQALSYLVGRVFLFTLLPFSFEEYLEAQAPGLLNVQKTVVWPDALLKELNHHWEDYAIYGGYPRVVLSKTNTEKREVLHNIHETYFLRDVRQTLGFKDAHSLIQLLQQLALQIGNLTQFQQLGQEIHASFRDLKTYLKAFEDTFVLYLLRPFFQNRKLELVKNPKPYFFDTGLRNAVVNDFRALKERPDAGALLENAFFQEVMRQGKLKGEPHVYYWRTKQGQELDFILGPSRDKLQGCEIKLNAEKNPKKTVSAFASRYPDIPAQVLFWQSKLGKEEDGQTPMAVFALQMSNLFKDE
jgi:predicted AAA+ superfamily ATPase